MKFPARENPRNPSANPESLTRDESPSPRERARWLKPLDRSIRLGLIALVAWVGWSTSQSLARLRTAGPLPVPRVSTSDPSQAIEAMLPDLADGYWTFAGSSWNFRRAEVSTAELSTRLDQDDSSSGALDTRSIPDQNRLLDAIDRLGIKSTRSGTTTRYTFDSDRLRGRLVANSLGDGSRAITACRLGLARTADRWILMELNARNVTSPSGFEQDHLLPLPADSNRLCGRWNLNNQLQLEVVTRATTEPPLSAFWAERGWSVRAVGRGEGRDDRLFCTRGAETIFAWAPRRESTGTLWILARCQPPR